MLIMGINCGLYKQNTDKGAIDWAFNRILKIRAQINLYMIETGKL